jgi:type IV pilus secretin PilQ/predicted competence protein
MIKTRNFLVLPPDQLRENCAKVLSMFALLGSIVGAHGLTGCASGKEAVSQPDSQKASAAKPAPAKPQSSGAPSQSLQELSVREEQGQTTLLVKFAQPVTQYRHFTLPQPARIVLDILDANKVTAADETYRIDTNWVSTLRLNANDGNLRLVAEISAASVPAYTIVAEDGALKIVIGARDPNANAKRNSLLVEGGQRVGARQVAPATGAGARALSRGLEDRSSSEKTYTGQKISLDFKDADIKNVFRLLAEVSGLNIVVTNDVNRRVTVRLVEVPWDQAMDLIITTNGLDKEQIGNVVRISTAGTMKAEKDALVAAKKAKEDLDPLQTVYYTLNYAKAKDLEGKIKPLMSKRSDAALVIDERSNTVMVRDIQNSVDDVSAMVGKLDLRTAQILIESNLVETTPTFSRALGMELDGLFNDNRVLGSSRFLAGAPFAGGAAGAVPVLPIPNSGFRFGYFGNNVRALLSAAENEGQVKIISRPSVVTLNNVPSTIKSERILRISLPSSTNIASGSGAAAGTAVATEKVPVGIILTVVPQVSSDGFVLMNIKVKSSSIANSPTVPAGTGGVVPFDELNREAEANVLVKDGETIVIGGILKDSDTSSVGGVPYLKDIPVFGWLFKNWRIQKDFEELVVFITPRVASAGSENLPTADELWRDQMKKTKGDQAASAPTNP